MNNERYLTTMKRHVSFYKIYIFRFIDFNRMQNKNAKQNIANYMRREDLKGCTYTSKSRPRYVTNVFWKIS